MNEAYLTFNFCRREGNRAAPCCCCYCYCEEVSAPVLLLLLLLFLLLSPLHLPGSPVSSLCCSFGSTIVAASRECLNASHSDREDGYIALRVVLLLQLLVALVVAVVVIAIVAAVVSCIRNVHFRFRFALDFEFFVNTLISFFYFVEFCCFTFV